MPDEDRGQQRIPWASGGRLDSKMQTLAGGRAYQTGQVLNCEYV